MTAKNTQKEHETGEQLDLFGEIRAVCQAGKEIGAWQKAQALADQLASGDAQEITGHYIRAHLGRWWHTWAPLDEHGTDEDACGRNICTWMETGCDSSAKFSDVELEWMAEQARALDAWLAEGGVLEISDQVLLYFSATPYPEGVAEWLDMACDHGLPGFIRAFVRDPAACWRCAHDMFLKSLLMTIDPFCEEWCGAWHDLP